MHLLLLLQQQQVQQLQQQTKGDPIKAPSQEEQFDMWLSTGEASSMGAEEVAGVLRVDVRSGLTWNEAEQRRSITGQNELAVLQEDPTWKKYIEQVCFAVNLFVCLYFCHIVLISLCLFFSLRIPL